MPALVAEARPLRKDAARNRELLLAAAADVFSELGLDAGVEEVARRAGVGMGTLYRRFPTKDALVDELAIHLLEEVLAAAEVAASRTDGMAVETFLLEVGGHFAIRGGLLCRLWTVPSPAAKIRELRALMAEVVRADQEAGTIRPELTASDLSVTMWGLQGVVETGGVAAPDAWRRSLAISLAGMSTGSRPLGAVPVTAAELEEVKKHKLR